MTLSCGSGKGRALMKKDGDIIFHVPVPNSTNFQQKNHQKSFGNDFDNFCVNFPTEFEF